MSGLPHPPILVEKAKRWVNSLDAWTLTALYSACVEAKSFYIGAGLIHHAMKAEAGDDDSTINGKEANNKNIVRDGKWAVGAARIDE